MSLLKFHLKDQHIKLLKQMKWGLFEDKFLISAEDVINDSDPFGGNDIYESIDLILNGRPENFDPFNTSEFPEYTQEQKTEWDILISELPTAMNVIMFNGSFEIGNYRTKFHDRNWIKY